MQPTNTPQYPKKGLLATAGKNLIHTWRDAVNAPFQGQAGKAESKTKSFASRSLSIAGVVSW